MIDIVLRPGEFESVGTEEFASFDGFFDLGDGGATAARYGKVDAVAGENRMNLVRYGRDETAKEAGGNLRRRFLMQFGEGELRGTVDANEEVELTLFCPDFGDVDIEEADRVGLELFP
jgi:hypothetical protein